LTATPEPAQAARPGTVAPIYVYGVVRSGSVRGLAVDGVADSSVSTIERGGLAAVTSELTEDRLRVRRRDLRAHLAVLEAVFAQATIVPCAFGMVLHSREAVESDLLDGRREELLSLLERLEGRMQLNIKAAYDEETVLREVVDSDVEIARLREQSRALGDAGRLANIRLGELVASALTERRVADVGRILDRLAAEADDVVVEEAPATVVLKASFLVARERSGRFDAALEALAAAEAPRLVFESIGPLPPTAFAALEARG
jgi:gas vesicle protein GvpL/GvpF